MGINFHWTFIENTFIDFLSETLAFCHSKSLNMHINSKNWFFSIFVPLLLLFNYYYLEMIGRIDWSYIELETKVFHFRKCFLCFHQTIRLLVYNKIQVSVRKFASFEWGETALTVAFIIVRTLWFSEIFHRNHHFPCLVFLQNFYTSKFRFIRMRRKSTYSRIHNS